MESKGKLLMKDYVAGGVVANALVWLAFGVSSFSEVNPLPFSLFLATYLVGSILGGFLVGRKVKQDYVKTGILTGLFSFMVHVYVFVGVFWIFSGPILFLEQHGMIFSVLLLGSCLGVFLSKLISLEKHS